MDSIERLARPVDVVIKALSEHYGQHYSGSYLQALALIARAENEGNEAVLPILKQALAEPPKVKNGGQISGQLIFCRLAKSHPAAKERVLTTANLGLDENGKAKDMMPFHNEMSDAVFMSCPLLCEAGRLTGNEEYFYAAWNHFNGIRRLCLRPDGLYRHSPLDESAWGRGNGFPALGLSMCLQILPPDWDHYEEMKTQQVAHLESLLPFQDENGMWHQVIDHPESYAEFTCTCMISVAAIRSMRRGWIDASKWEPVIEKAWRAVLGRISLDGSELNGCCTGTGKQKNLEAYLKRKEIHGRDERGGAMALLFATEMSKWGGEE